MRIILTEEEVANIIRRPLHGETTITIPFDIELGNGSLSSLVSTVNILYRREEIHYAGNVAHVLYIADKYPNLLEEMLDSQYTR